MATSISAFKIPAGQPPAKAPKSDAERAKAYRQKKRAEAIAPPSAEHLIPPDFVPPADYVPMPSIAEAARLARTVSRPPVASIALMVAAFGLAGVGVTQNGWFARSLGADVTAGWLFLAVGVASDLAALVLPAVAARAWHAGHRGAALAGWSVWIVAFCFAVTASVGFTALNVSTVTASRASAVTPAVTAAQSALDDAKAARTRECASGNGKFCRTREEMVINMQAALDQAMQAVSATADPQTTAAVQIVAWITHGAVRPSSDDFAMLRLILLALLPQVGGVLLMLARFRYNSDSMPISSRPL